MKNLRKGILFAAVLTLAVALTACGNASPSSSPAPAASAAVSAAATSAEKTFTAAELAKYNGQNGNPAYVAVNGVVYDVSNVPQWMGGAHHGHTAGMDLTQQIAQSPHGTSVLKNLPVVGKYVG